MNKPSYYQILVSGRPLNPVSLRSTAEALVADVLSVSPKAPIQVLEICQYDITSEFVKSSPNDQRVEGSGNPDSME